MPGIIFDDSVADTGDSILSGSRVYYVAWGITDFGPSARHPSYWDTGAYLGIGYFQLGNDLTPGGILSGIGWGEPHWFYNELGQIIVSPGEIDGNFTSDIAQYIRWALSPGNTAHLIVFGDT